MAPHRRRGRCAVAVLALVAMPAFANAGPPQPVAQLGSERFRQTNPVAAITYSADGKRLATIDGNAIHVWDASDGRLLSTTRTRNHELLAVAFEAKSGNLLAAAYFDRQTWICRIDHAADKPPSRRAVLTDKATCLFSPSGKYLALRNEGLALVMDTTTGKAVISDWRIKDKFKWFTFRSDSLVVAVSTEAGLVRVYDLTTGEARNEFRVEGGTAAGMVFAPDGKHLVIEIGATEWSHLACFDVATGKMRWRHETHLARQPAFTADGTAVRYHGVASSSNDPVCWHWVDAVTGKLQGQPMFAEFGEPATRPDGKVLAIGGRDGLVSQWDLKSRKRLDDSSADPPEQVTEVRFTPDGKKVRGWARGWYEWDLKTAKQTRLTRRTEHDSSDAITGSHDQKWLVRCSVQGQRGNFRFELVNLESGECARLLPAGQSPHFVRFTPAGRMIVFEGNRLTIIEPDSGKELSTVGVGPNAGEVIVSDDGTCAIEVTRLEGGLRVVHWNLISGRRARTWEYRFPDPAKMTDTFARRAKLSTDGRLLAIPLAVVESDSRDVHQSGVFHTDSGRLISSWSDESYWSDTAFSPDGRAMAIQSGLGIQVREVATGRIRLQIPADRAVSSCGFSPDGRLLAVATRPHPIEIYDLAADLSAGKWNPEKLDGVWATLARPDAAAAFTTICQLRAYPTEAMAFLRQRLKPPKAPDRDWLAARVRDLDAASYRDREKATADLAAAGEFVADALRHAEQSASPEARQRIANLLPKVETMTPEMLRSIRACEVLEGIATAEARSLLVDWARLAPASTLGREAAESLERIQARTR
jgi:WD40 repeat protein